MPCTSGSSEGTKPLKEDILQRVVVPYVAGGVISFPFCAAHRDTAASPLVQWCR